MVIEIVSYILCFLVGYILGRMNFIQKHINIGEMPKTASKGVNPKKLSKVEIDESKYVTKIKTDNYTKAFDKLGNKTVKEDSINSSVSKLSQLKNKKKK